MKLKTLKDIDGTYEQGAITLILQDYVQKSKLKKEAIKWVKDMDITKSVEYCNGRIDFIMEFFNITREDLK